MHTCFGMRVHVSPQTRAIAPTTLSRCEITIGELDVSVYMYAKCKEERLSFKKYSIPGQPNTSRPELPSALFGICLSSPHSLFAPTCRKSRPASFWRVAVGMTSIKAFAPNPTDPPAHMTPRRRGGPQP
jgi:hypothetical protein